MPSSPPDHRRHITVLAIGATLATASVLSPACRSWYPYVPGETDTGTGGGTSSVTVGTGAGGAAVGTGSTSTSTTSSSSTGATVGPSTSAGTGGTGNGGASTGSAGQGGASAGSGGTATGGASSTSASAGGSTTSSTAAASSSSTTVAASSSSTAASSSGSVTCGIGHVVISQIRSRGAGGANDELVELYNATGADVVLDNTWVIKVRSATGSTYPARWTGTGKTIPAWGHFLIVGSSYAETPAGDETLSAGITDSASVILNHGNSTVDAVCYYATNLTLATATTDFATATCTGTPVSNAPHSDNSGMASDVDVSIVRKPGGTGDNCVDSGDNAADFVSETPAVPRSSASAPTP